MKRQERKVRLSGRIAFVIYILILIYFLFFAEWFGRGTGRYEEFSYNLRPLVEIRRFIKYRQQVGFDYFFLNIAGNVIGFIPIGMILPVMSRRFYSFFRTVLFGFSLSFLVECLQLITRAGTFDVDDIILNTAGTIIGYLIFVAARLIRRKILFG